MKSIPFITASTGHVMMVEKKDVIPEILSIIQDTYTGGGELAPYWRVLYHRYPGSVCVDIFYTGLDWAPTKVPVSLLIAAWGNNSSDAYKSLVGKDEPPFLAGRPIIISKLTAALPLVPPDGIYMLGDLEKVLGVFLLELNIKNLWD